MSDPERTDRDLSSEPIRFNETEERLQGYALGCFEGCGLLAGGSILLVLIVLAILFA
ncbi:MAG: hypothetical protein U0837_06590 [Dehalococcoidia bacterium]|jgi:hypothetical protein